MKYEVTDEFAPICGVARTKSAKIVCEYPPDHVVGTMNGKPVIANHHAGRDARDHWITWEAPDYG